MRPFPLFALSLAAAPALAQQPSLRVSVDRDAYTAGEPIVVEVEVANPRSESVTYWGSSSCRVQVELGDGDLLPQACTLDEAPLTIPAGARWTRTFTLYPDSLGVPDVSGGQEVVAHPQMVAYLGGGTPSGPRDSDATLEEDRAAFVAPAAQGGFVYLTYPEGTGREALAPLRDSLNADVRSAARSGGMWREEWHISGDPFAPTVARYAADPRFSTFEQSPGWWVEYVDAFATASERSPERRGHLFRPFPNPCRGECEVRIEGVTRGRVALHDALGREVAVLHDGPLPAAGRSLEVPAGRLAAGVYTVRLRAEGVREHVRLVRVQ